MSDEDAGYREDCNPRCRGYWRVVDGRRTECCGGCPMQCYCALEQDRDAEASREEGFDYSEYDGDYDAENFDPAESDYGDGEGA